MTILYFFIYLRWFRLTRPYSETIIFHVVLDSYYNGNNSFNSLIVSIYNSQRLATFNFLNDEVFIFAISILGVGADLSHIETIAKVTAHMGPENLDECVKDASLVLIPAGMPRKPGKAIKSCC